MTLDELVKLLSNIKDEYHDAYSATVKMCQWDDGAYDGVELDGVRLIYDYAPNNGFTLTCYLIQKQ